MRAGSIITNLSKILTAIKESAPVAQINQTFAQGEADPTWLRANSFSKYSDAQRAQMRHQILKGELHGKEEVDSKAQAEEGSPAGEGGSGGTDIGRQDKPVVAQEQGVGPRPDGEAGKAGDSLQSHERSIE